jgi:hypothetical protein
MANTLVNVVVEEPVQVDAYDHDWDAVIDFQVVLPVSLRRFDELLTGCVGKAPDGEVVGRNGRISFNYEWQRQNSPEIDQNSLLRRIRISASEFSIKDVPEFWMPLVRGETVDCYCDERGCETGLTVDTDEQYITMSDAHGLALSIQLPPDVRLCRVKK